MWPRWCTMFLVNKNDQPKLSTLLEYLQTHWNTPPACSASSLSYSSSTRDWFCLFCICKVEISLLAWYAVQIKETCFSEAISAWKHIFIILGMFSFHWTKHLLKTFHIFGKASLLVFSVVLLNQARLPQPLVFILILILILIPTLYKIRTLLTGSFCTP